MEGYNEGGKGYANSFTIRMTIFCTENRSDVLSCRYAFRPASTSIQNCKTGFRLKARRNDRKKPLSNII